MIDLKCIHRVKEIKDHLKGHKYSDGQGIKVGTSFFKEDDTRSKGPILQEGSGECPPWKVFGEGNARKCILKAS